MTDQELIARLDRLERASLLGPKEILSLKDLALMMGLSEKTIRNRLEDIPHYRNSNPVGPKIVFKRTEIAAWMCRVKCIPIELERMEEKHKSRQIKM